MLNISLQEAKNKLPELINLVKHGEEVFIIGDNKTKIKLVSFTEKHKKRVFGQHCELAIMSENFNSRVGFIPCTNHTYLFKSTTK